MTVQLLYDDVCEVMLEPGGFTLGLVTPQQFLDYYVETMEDFLGRTGLIKGIALQTQQYGTPDYDLPDWISDIEAVYSDGGTLFRDSENSIAAMNQNWRSEIDTPRAWRQDKMPMQSLSLFPAPKVQGDSGGQDPGIVSAYVPGQSPNPLQAFVGTLNQTAQVASFTTPGTFFTPPSGAVPLNQLARKNVAMIGKLGLMTEAVALGDPIEHLTDDFAVFLKYGILQKIFGVDGENKDVLRENYCRDRYEEGVMLGKAIMGEEVEAA